MFTSSTRALCFITFRDFIIRTNCENYFFIIRNVLQTYSAFHVIFAILVQSIASDFHLFLLRLV